MEVIRLKKPLILLRETDPSKGATNAAMLRMELDALDVSGELPFAHHQAGLALIDVLSQADEGSDLPIVIEWHREKTLKLVALKMIVAHVSQHQPQGQGTRVGHVREVRLQSDIVALQNVPLGSAGTVYLSREYRNRHRHLSSSSSVKGLNIFDECHARFGEFGIAVVDSHAPLLPHVIMLCPDAFDDAALVAEIARILMAAKFAPAGGRPLQIIALASTCRPFGWYMSRCADSAPQLKELGLFSHFFLKWPTSRVLQQQMVLEKALPVMPQFSDPSGGALPGGSMKELLSRRTSLFSDSMRLSSRPSERTSGSRSVLGWRSVSKKALPASQVKPELTSGPGLTTVKGLVSAFSSAATESVERNSNWLEQTSSESSTTTIVDTALKGDAKTMSAGKDPFIAGAPEALTLRHTEPHDECSDARITEPDLAVVADAPSEMPLTVDRVLEGLQSTQGPIQPQIIEALKVIISNNEDVDGGLEAVASAAKTPAVNPVPASVPPSLPEGGVVAAAAAASVKACSTRPMADIDDDELAETQARARADATAKLRASQGSRALPSSTEGLSKESSFGGSASSKAPSQREPAALPSRWETAISSDRTPYYYDRVSRVAQWNHPGVTEEEDLEQRIQVLPSPRSLEHPKIATATAPGGEQVPASAQPQERTSMHNARWIDSPYHA